MANLRKRIAQLSLLESNDVVLEEMINAELQMNLEIDREEIYWKQQARAN